jgi:radical SAM superfamily enzyme YgiQ (UPF0313 family)
VTPKSIIFIEPSGNPDNVFGNYMNLPLTGCLYLGTILHNAGHQVRILNEAILPRPIDPFELRADVFCITALTVSVPRARQLAVQLRRACPQARILVGGIHASLVPHEFEDVADQVVVGEAENIIIDLIDGKCSGKVVQGSAVEDVDTLPVVNYRLLEGWERLDIVPIMTSRGCPFDCNFCTVTKIFGKRFRMQSPKRVLAEMKNALATLNSRAIFFYDDNFTANRARVEELCSLIAAEKLDISWSAQVRSDIGRDPELLRRMAGAGCDWFFVGFESINDATLKAYHKSQTKTDIEEAISAIHQASINIHGMFIFGEDNDTVESLRASVDFAIRHEIETVQWMILTPFPGTQLHARLAAENRILHAQWDCYDGMHVVFRPVNMSPTRLLEEAMGAYQRFYSLRRYLLNLLRFVFGLTMDALTWNYRRVFRYGFQVLILRAGAKILVTRYVGRKDAFLKSQHEPQPT